LKEIKPLVGKVLEYSEWGSLDSEALNYIHDFISKENFKRELKLIGIKWQILWICYSLYGLAGQFSLSIEFGTLKTQVFYCSILNEELQK
jgi:hypothetical protein